MSQILNTKIQYKTCEKGEFFGEQPRSPDEIIELVKNFPWDRERGTDIQLSGPGIVIEGADGSYFKVALYFNGKFSVYYLDPANHLYEYHTPELTDECQKVKEYIEGNLNLDGFDKHFFNIGNRGHFVTRSFVYTASLWGMAWPPALIGGYLCVIVLILTRVNGWAGFIAGITILLAAGILISAMCYSCKNMYLQISKGHDEFMFADNSGVIKLYNKEDIREVVIYQGRNARGSGPYSNAEIYLKDGTMLKLPNVLISPLTLVSKFSDKIVRIEYRKNWNFIGR